MLWCRGCVGVNCCLQQLVVITLCSCWPRVFFDALLHHSKPAKCLLWWQDSKKAGTVTKAGFFMFLFSEDLMETQNLLHWFIYGILWGQRWTQVLSSHRPPALHQMRQMIQMFLFHISTGLTQAVLQRWTMFGILHDSYQRPRKPAPNICSSGLLL